MKNIIHNNDNMIENKWIEYRWISNNIIITLDLLTIILNQFKIDVINKLNKDQYIYVLLKLKMHPGSATYGGGAENNEQSIFRSITKMQRVNKESVDILIEVFYESWLVKSSGWGLQSGDNRIFEIEEVIFSYKILPLFSSIEANINTSKINKIESKSKEKIYDDIRFSGYNLPITADYNKWGEIILNSDNKVIIQKLNSQIKYHMQILFLLNFS